MNSICFHIAFSECVIYQQQTLTLLFLKLWVFPKGFKMTKTSTDEMILFILLAQEFYLNLTSHHACLLSCNSFVRLQLPIPDEKRLRETGNNCWQ